MKVVQLIETLIKKVRITMNLINLIIVLISASAVRLMNQIGIINVIARLQ